MTIIWETGNNEINILLAGFNFISKQFEMIDSRYVYLFFASSHTDYVNIAASHSFTILLLL